MFKVLSKIGLKRRDWASWALFDWAHSSFITSIVTAIMPVFFNQYATHGTGEGFGLAAWSYITAACLAIIAILAPWLGAVADVKGWNKRFLIFFSAQGCIGTLGLCFIQQGGWQYAAAVFVVAMVGYGMSLVFANALLPHLAEKHEINELSTKAWAVGYYGGGLLFLLHVTFMSVAKGYGLLPEDVAIRIVFASVALWWGFFMLPLVWYVEEPEVAKPKGSQPMGAEPAGTDSFARLSVQSLSRLRNTLGEIGNYKNLFLFLCAYWLYSDGIGTIMKMSTIYGDQMGIGTSHLMGTVLMIQFIGGPSTILFGKWSKKIGTRTAIEITLGGYIIICLIGYFMTAAWHFWLLGLVFACIQGPALSLSRAVFASMVPEGKSSEFFGFFSLSERFAGIAGPLLFGVIGQFLGEPKYSILFLIVFFVLGWVMLRRVKLDI